MPTVIFALLVLIHALIHSLGFVKAFNLAKVEQLVVPISRPAGVLWLVSALGFALCALLLTTGKNWWGFVAIPLVLLSQILVILSWSDAKYGTLVNLIIVTVAIISIGLFFIENRFETLVNSDLKSNSLSTEILTEADIAHLPTPVQKYLHYTKAVGQPKVNNFRAEFVGKMRSGPKDGDMNFHSLQYNFYQNPSRYFFMTASKMGVPATGLHVYQNNAATFDVKLLNWIPVVSAKGEKLNQAETVTLFNDMCFIAPSTLIDQKITWKQIDDLTVKGIYQNGDITIDATLYFNEKRELINFISDDRYETDGKKYNNYVWKTPVSDYKELRGYLLPSKAKLIYERPDGDFTYGEMEYKDVRYNN